jgi:hypothetical protein
MSGFHISRLPLASLVGIDVNGSQELAYTMEGFVFLPSCMHRVRARNCGCEMQGGRGGCFSLDLGRALMDTLCSML